MTNAGKSTPVAPLERINVAFDSAEDDECFNGYTDGKRWNGFECPWFEVDTYERVLKWLEADNLDSWRRVGDQLFVDWGGGEHPVEFREVDTVDGRKMLAYMGGGFTFVCGEPSPEPDAPVLDVAVSDAGKPTTTEPCDHSEWGPECPFCGEPAIPLFDKDVIAIVEALAEYECRTGSPVEMLMSDGVTSLPALRPLMERYKEITTK